jgi:type II secretory pathway pseudopilin PulG
MSRLRAESGVTLIELQIVLVLMVGVLGAVLTTFNESEETRRVNQDQNEAQDRNRLTIDRVARELRNLASPSTQNPEAVERNWPDDLIFETVAAVRPDGSTNARNISRVRYCLGASSGGKEALLRQEHTWTTPSPPPDMPQGTACPDSAWPALPGSSLDYRTVAQDVVNREQGAAVFSYDSTDPQSVYSIGVDLIVDIDPSRRPVASRLSSSVFLRNQNQAPMASATATDTGTGHRLLLNGSASTDPEGATIARYEWYADGSFGTAIATGPVVYWAPSGTTWPQTHDITLRVVDSGGRSGEITLEDVSVN